MASHRDTQNDATNETSQNRRRLLKTVGAAGVASIAGCSDNSSGDGGDGNGSSDGSDGGNGNGSSDGSDGGELVDSVYEAGMVDIPDEVQFNAYNPTQSAWQPTEFIYDLLMNYHQSKQEFIPVIVSDWSFDGKTMTLQMNEDYTWHNSDSVTADDLATKLKLNRYMEYPISDFVNSINASGEYAVELGLASTVNESVIMHTLFGSGSWLDTPHSRYKDKLQAFEDATTESETKSARESLIKWVPDWGASDVIGNGPWQAVSADTERFQMKRYDAYPRTDAINFPELHLKYQSSVTQGRWAAVKSDNVDAIRTMFAPGEVIDKFPDHWIGAETFAFNDGGLHFQFDHPVFGDRRVRQAIGHIVDPESLEQAYSSRNVTEPYTVPPCGISMHRTEKWLGDALGDFTAYEPNQQQAADYLREAGFSKDGDTWTKPDGKSLSVEILLQSGRWVSIGQTLVSALESFGINATVRTAEGATFQTRLENGDFSIAITWWNGSFYNGGYPYFGMRGTFVGNKDSHGYPDAFSVPMPVGDPGGTEEKVDVHTKLTELSKTQDDNREKQLIRELAWVYNQVLPVIPITEKVDLSWVSNDDWTVPKESDAAYKVPFAAWWLMRDGKMQAKTA